MDLPLFAKENDIQLMQKIFGNRSAKGRFAFDVIKNILDLKMYNETNQIKVIKQQRSNIVVLKLDKGNKVILINNTNYILAVANLFNNTNKLKIIESNSIIT